MKKEYLKIKMDDVRDIVRKRGYYFISAERLFDKRFVGPKLYIVTDDPDFPLNHPELADMVIMTVCEFEPIAQAVNEYMGNEDRERHRTFESVSIDENAEKIADIVDDKYEMEILRERMIAALDHLSETQRRRLKMYFFEDKTQLEIAKIEGVRLFAVQKSVEKALKKIKEFF